MNNPRSFLALALLLVGYLIWVQWQEDYHPAKTSTSAINQNAVIPSTPTALPPADIPSANSANADKSLAAVTESSVAKEQADSSHVVVTTDVLRVEIDTRGGSITVADLLAYPQKPKDYAHPIRLLDDNAATFFQAQSGLVSAQNPAPDHQTIFQAEKTDYLLSNDQDSLEVPLTWQDASGLAVRKVFIFKRGSYVIEQRQDIENKTSTTWTGNAYRQLQRVPPIIDTSGIKGYSNTERYSFVGAAWYSAVDKFQKLTFDSFTEEPLNKTLQGGWAALLQHYFFAAWIPSTTESAQYTSQVVQSGAVTRYLIRIMSPTLSVAPGETKTDSARLYIGPKLQSTLDQVAPGLELTIDYGIFTIVAQPLYWILAQLEKLSGNWGLAIIMLVLLIKAVFFKLSEAQYRSMARMRKLQPRIESLRERYGDDRQKLNQAMMELYQKEKINPLGGCLPMLVQMPVFLALYWVLMESVELRQAPFVGWIQNLSAPDPYFVLPILNGAAMIASQWLTPMTGMDPIQAKMMKAMPVVFAVMFAFFPAGLVLYWAVNGILTLLQQVIIMRRVEAAGAKT